MKKKHLGLIYYVFLIPICLLNSKPIWGQANVITELWSETNGSFSDKFGAPTTFDSNGDFYRAGFESQNLGGTDVKLQKLDPEGSVLWDIQLNTSTQDAFEPSNITTNGTSIFVTGIVTNYNSSTTDIFISKIDLDGTIEWFTIDEVVGNDIASDIVYDGTSDVLYICGTSERNGTYDLLLESFDGSGNISWTETLDHAGFSDVGININIEGSLLIVTGSSEAGPTDWDIVSWYYDFNGNFLSEERTNGAATSSDELKDAALSNGHLALTGSSFSSSLDFKVICFDANNQFLWEDTYDQNGLHDAGTAVLVSTNSFIVTGYATPTLNDENILIRKYDYQGNLIWTNSIDYQGQNDRGIDVIQDQEGNYVLLATVSTNNQSDVRLYYINEATGSVLWEEAVAQNANESESGISLLTSLSGAVYVTYEHEQQLATEVYGYQDLNYPTPLESYSKSCFYIENGGQVKNTDNNSVENIRYTTFGMDPTLYFGDDFFKAQILNHNTDEVHEIDINFLNANSTHVGQIIESEKATKFNYSFDETQSEHLSTFDVLAYPEIYNNINAFYSTNSEGFKLTFVLENGADINDIALDIQGSLGLSQAGSTLEIATVGNAWSWLAPYSYPQNNPEPTDDACVTYVLEEHNLSFYSSCEEISYPYVIELKVGLGKGYTPTSIENLDWSTFFGGNNIDVFKAVTTDYEGNIYAGGATYSSQLNTNGVYVNGLTNTSMYNGMVAKFKHDDLSLVWVTILPDKTDVTAIKTADIWTGSTNYAGSEILVVGEVKSNLSPQNNYASTAPTGFTPYQQAYVFDDVSNTANPERNMQDGFFTALKASGAIEILSAFGGQSSQHRGDEYINAMEITYNNGVPFMYFVGSTDNGSTAAASSTTAPTGIYQGAFPVYDANDGSFFQANHTGNTINFNKLGFITVLNLQTFELAYSTILPAYSELFDIDLLDYAAVCGRYNNQARYDRFNPWQQLFTSTLTPPLSPDFSNDIEEFSSVITYSSGNILLGINQANPNSLWTNVASPSYQSNLGKFYLAYIPYASNTVSWDTYFGAVGTNVATYYGRSTATGIGTMDKGSILASGNYTVFVGSSVRDYAVETQTKPGHFYESIISANNSTESDAFIASFTNNAIASHVFGWGTMFGGNGNDWLSDMTTYRYEDQTYLLSVGTTFSTTGTFTSNIEDFPVADLPASFFQKDKSNSTSGPNNDGFISRFNISNTSIGIEEQENAPTSKIFTVFPNPSGNVLNVHSLSLPIENISIYNLSGKCVAQHLPAGENGNSHRLTLSLQKLPPGLYTVSINNTHHEKIIKL